MLRMVTVTAFTTQSLCYHRLTLFAVTLGIRSCQMMVRLGTVIRRRLTLFCSCLVRNFHAGHGWQFPYRCHG